MAQIIELNQSIDYIDIDTSKVPYTFMIKLIDRTYKFTIKYNEVGGFFTVDLETANGEVLCYGDPIRYGRPLFESISDERFPLPIIVPYCLTGDNVSEVTKDNMGKEVKLYLYSRG